MKPVIELSDQLNYLKRKQRLLNRYSEIVSHEGYVLYEPDDFETYERFMRINERVEPASMVKVTDNHGDVLILRPDVTTQVIDRLIPKWDGGEPLKLYYDTTVYKHTDGGIAGNRHFGVETIASNRESSDDIIISLATRLLNEGTDDYVFVLGNQRFLNALFSDLNLSQEKLARLKEIITYKNDYELRRFVENESIGEPSRSRLLKLFELEGDLKDVEQASQALNLTSAMQTALNELRRVKDTMNGANTIYDLSLLSEYDYYEGVVFRAYGPESPRAILKGGRYAPLKESDASISAIGFSIDIETLLLGGKSNES